MGRLVWQRRKRVLLLAVATLASLLGIAGYATGTLYSLEAQTVNTRFAIRGTDHRLVRDFVIVQVDAHSFSELSQHGLSDRWPFPRRYHARVIDNLLAAGAK